MESNQSSAPLSLALAERFPQGLESPIPDQLKDVLETLIKFHPASDRQEVVRAYQTADYYHRFQNRKSGEQYITHPIAVAGLLADLGMTTPTIIAALLALKFVKESKAEGNNTYDIPGVITATAGLFSLTYGFNEAATKGWSSSTTISFLVAAVVLLVVFVVIEKKVANPLMPLRVVTERNRGGSYLGSLVVGAGLFSMFLFLGLYLQVILGYSPLKSGFAFLPFTAGIIVFAGIASQLLPKFGPRPLMVPGLIFAGIGLLMMTRITPDTSYSTHVLPSLLIMSSGMALVFIPLTSTSLHGVSNHDTGVASAMLNTSQQIGGSLGTALLNTIAATATATYAAANTQLGDRVMPFAMTHGFTVAFKFSAVLLFAGAVVLFFFINIGKESLVETEGVSVH